MRLNKLFNYNNKTEQKSFKKDKLASAFQRLLILNKKI